MFNDLVLARMLCIDNTRNGGVDSTLDRGWQEKVTLRLAPHPDLSPARRLAIELDYDMMDGSVAFEMRASLVYYFVRH